VAIAGRALLLEGPPGIGKSSLALALMERGALLIGDDAVTLACDQNAGSGRLTARAAPNIEGLIEVRGVGLVRVSTAGPTPLALILTLLGPADPEPERLPENAPLRRILGCAVPVLPFRPGAIAPAERALRALEVHGLG
jgi:serine kinase of HPr protein (carbohydrate metabolism regulator)